MWCAPSEIDGRDPSDAVSDIVIDNDQTSENSTLMFDITASRLRQGDAASLANILLATLSHINDYAYIFDLQGRFLYANQPLLDLWGLPLEAAVGKNFFDLNYPADLAARLQSQIQEVIESRKPVRGETPYTSESGQAGFYEYIFNPVFGKDGQVTNVAGSTRVITERKQHEAELARLVQEKETQARLFDATLSSINDLAYSFDLEGNWMYANNSLLKLWGRTLPEIVGKSSLELDYPPELAATLKAQVKQVVATGKPFRGETFFTDAAGVVDYHEYIFSPVFAPDGSVTAVCGTTRLITQRKRAETQLIQQKEVLEQIVQGAPLLEILESLTRNVEQFAERKLVATILLMAPDGRHLLSAAGRSAPEEWSRYIHGVEIGAAVGSCGTAAFRGERVIVSDIATDPLWADYKEEALRHGLRACWSSPLHSSDGKVLGTFAIYYSEPSEPTKQELEIIDIVTRTAAIAIERKISEQALQESREKLEEHARTLERRVTERTADLQETNEQLEQFCYTIAHDLRAPLRAQEGFATLLKDDFAEALGAKGQNYADRIVGAARRLDRLVQDLLNFSRIGRGSWHIEPMPLRMAFEEARQNLAETIRHTHAELTVGTLDGAVRVHPATLMLILQNLLANALKFSRPGVPPKINVWTETREKFVRFNVKDEGIGIPPEQHERIFGVFQRLHDTAAYPGTGIGLSLVRKGIERMGGRVGLESVPGHGSLFWIELPKAS
ncbi:MAG TPA: PAS domain-containing protein, partial [Verrucomicrobiae bacterium]